MDIKFKLIKSTYTVDSIGQYVPTESARYVYGTKKPITRTEWNTAGQRGLKPEFMVSMFTYDYQYEDIAEVEGKRYGIYRTYTNGDTIELYMEKKEGV